MKPPGYFTPPPDEPPPPPLGATPRWIWLETRIIELCEAIVCQLEIDPAGPILTDRQAVQAWANEIVQVARDLEEAWQDAMPERADGTKTTFVRPTTEQGSNR